MYQPYLANEFSSGLSLSSQDSPDVQSLYEPESSSRGSQLEKPDVPGPQISKQVYEEVVHQPVLQVTREEVYEMLGDLVLTHAEHLRGPPGKDGGPPGRQGEPGPPGQGLPGPQGERGEPGQVKNDFSWYNLFIDKTEYPIEFSSSPFSICSGHMSSIYTTTPYQFVSSVVLDVVGTKMTWTVKTNYKFDIMFLSYRGLTLTSDDGYFTLDLSAHFDRFIKPEAEYTLAVRWAPL